MKKPQKPEKGQSALWLGEQKERNEEKEEQNTINKWKVDHESEYVENSWFHTNGIVFGFIGSGPNVAI